MFRTTISNGSSTTHETEQEANEWIAREVANNSWGKPDRWLYFPASDISELNDEGVPMYFHPAEYTYKTKNITSEVAREKKISSLIATGKKAKQACDDCLNFVRGYNTDRSLEDINQMIVEFTNILTLLSLGQPKTAKGVIEMVSSEQYAELKSDLLEILKDY